MRIAVLGMGRMGHEVAGRLVAGGHDVTVWNRSPHKADDLAGRGATDRSGSPAGEAVRGVEVVVTLLSDDAAVRAVVIEGGVAEAITVGGGPTTLVDMSTVSPRTSQALAESVGPERFVASPVLGAPSAVRSGRAVYLVAGPPERLAALGPMFVTLSARHLELGDDPGRALVVKLLANSLLLSGVVVLGEVVATAQAAGLDDGFLRELLGSSPILAPALRDRLDNMLSGQHDAWFTTALGAKDVRLAEELAAAYGLRLPVFDAVKRRYEEAVAEGWGGDDLTAVVELNRRALGEPG